MMYYSVAKGRRYFRPPPAYERMKDMCDNIIVHCFCGANIIEKAELNTFWVFHTNRRNIRNYHVTLQGYLYRTLREAILKY